MGANQVFEVIWRYELLEQECMNVFFYRGNADSSPGLDDIAESFIDDVLPALMALQTDDVLTTSIQVRDILQAETPYIELIGANGTAGAGEVLPSHDALSYTFNVQSSDTRPGGKRIAGIGEGGMADGIITGGGFIGTVNDAADEMQGALFDAATGLINYALPVIVKRILVSEGVYRLPATIGELLTNFVTEVVPNLIVSSQVSRKRRG